MSRRTRLGQSGMLGDQRDHDAGVPVKMAKRKLEAYGGAK